MGEELERGMTAGERAEGERERALRIRAKRVVSLVGYGGSGVRGVVGGEDEVEAVEVVLGVGEPSGCGWEVMPLDEDDEVRMGHIGLGADEIGLLGAIVAASWAVNRRKRGPEVCYCDVSL